MRGGLRSAIEAVREAMSVKGRIRIYWQGVGKGSLSVVRRDGEVQITAKGITSQEAESVIGFLLAALERQEKHNWTLEDSLRTHAHRLRRGRKLKDRLYGDLRREGGPKWQ